MTLPAFLLEYIDSNLVWAGCKRLALPAVNARWSLARVIALTLLHTAMGVALGCIISLLMTGQLLGWLIWILGVLMTCQALVCMPLTALCWNQRVARLQENPNLPLHLPPARFVLARWALGLIYFFLLALITPLAMLVTIENVRGQLAWKRERARLEAQGEHLTFREILGPEIPAADNAGAAPIFKPFYDYDPSAFAGGPVDSSLSLLRGQSSNAVARIKEAVFVPYNHLPDRRDVPAIYSKYPEIMADWSAAYRKLIASPAKDDPSWVASLKLPAPGDPTRDVLAGLAEGDAVVAEICKASARPRAQFAVHWGEGFSVLLPVLPILKSAQQNLKLRCAAHLAAGETGAAFADATNALNVAELLREEPLLISQLVRMAQGALATATLWEGLVEHRWSDAQLAAFQERLSRVDYLQGLVRAFEGERAGGIVGVDALIAGAPGPGQPGSGTFRRAAMIVPLGVLRQNQVALVRHHTALLTNLRAHIAQAPQAAFAPSVQALAEKERTRSKKESYVGVGPLTDNRREGEQAEPYSPFTVLAKMMAPALARAETRAARIQTTVNLAITACALERHRLAHGSYPEKLDALVPAFMPKLLLDLMNGQPFQYRRTEDGWFLLYSVGEDGQDDGGVFRAKPKERIKDWPWPVPTRAEAGSLF